MLYLLRNNFKSFIVDNVGGEIHIFLKDHKNLHYIKFFYRDFPSGKSLTVNQEPGELVTVRETSECDKNLF